jgi:homogentisate 1,2-dioxygenase
MSRQWIAIPKIEGTASRQAHADFPEKTYERELGKEGFFGPCTHMHHKNPPTNWIDWEGPLRPVALDLNKLPGEGQNPWQAPQVFSNPHIDVRYWRLNQSMEQLVRNGDGDQLLFVHKGTANLFCDYGHLSLEEGDYLMIPRGTLWRLDVKEPLEILLIEAVNDSFQLPEKGILGHHAIFDQAMLDAPTLNDTFKAQRNDDQIWKILIKRRNRFSTVTYAHNPLDAVGWHGTLMPVRINVRDIRPLMSHRYHLPPSAHTTFITKRFVVCTFCPRPLESDPGALKVPFYHNNDDFDEILFYHAGDFFSRDNIHPGMMTIHPCGFTHGPHPKAFKAAMTGKKTETDEIAVMIDTRDAIDIADMPAGVEWKEYINSWRTGLLF